MLLQASRLVDVSLASTQHSRLFEAASITTMGCIMSSSKDDEFKPGTRDNSFRCGSVHLRKMSFSSTLKRQSATTGPLAPGMGRNTSLGQTLPLDESTRKAKGSRQRAADARLFQNEELYTEKSFNEFASMYIRLPTQACAPEVAAPEVVASEMAAPVVGTLAWFTAPPLVSSPVCVCPPKEAEAASPGGY